MRRGSPQRNQHLPSDEKGSLVLPNNLKPEARSGYRRFRMDYFIAEHRESIYLVFRLVIGSSIDGLVSQVQVDYTQSVNKISTKYTREDEHMMKSYRRSWSDVAEARRRQRGRRPRNNLFKVISEMTLFSDANLLELTRVKATSPG
jgi:hypothetical protein